jgi:hypothetical protein
METMEIDSDFIRRSAGVPKNILLDSRNLSGPEDEVDETHPEVDEYFSKIPKTLLKALYREIYFLDFELFGYDVERYLQ